MSSYGSMHGANGVGKNGKSDGETTPLVESVLSPLGSKNVERSLWNRLTFRWFTPILYRGNEKKKLDQTDLDMVPLPEDCTTSDIYATFEKYWNTELETSNPSLVRALWYSFGADYIQAGFLKMGHDLCIFVGPQVLHAIIVFLRTPDAKLTHGLGLAFAVTVSQILMSLCLRHYFFKCYTAGLRIRTCIVIAVYRKALVLASGERQTRSLGEITNLMSIDAQRLQELTTYLHAIWSSPLQISLALMFLWQQLGASCLGGVSVIVIMIPVTKYVSTWMGMMQKGLMKAKDRRVEVNSEVLSGMKVIKLQAWEEPFAEKIIALREVELKKLFEYYVGTSFSRMLWTFTPLAVALATFSVYVWSGHQLDVAEALTALALFDILRFPLFMLPMVINGTVEAAVSLKRVRDFLLCDEHRPMRPGSLADVGIRMKDVSAAYASKKPKVNPSNPELATKELAEQQWELTLLKSRLEDAERLLNDMFEERAEMASTDSLGTSYSSEEMTAQQHSQPIAPSLLCVRRINFEIKPGQLVAVVGGVGCGKSSFVNTILGEVRTLSGTTEVNGNLSYFSQTPFIMNASVRDNILFGHIGEPVDEELYQRALSCCALAHDLELLPDGEDTEVGEKGITLSGGQKARVALARAVYHAASITVIDDALSAVDAHVASQLFNEAIVGELMDPPLSGGKRSVVLVTNALQFLKHPKIDKIVVLREGRVVEQGRYDQLANRPGSVFARYLSVIDDTDMAGDLAESAEQVGVRPDASEGATPEPLEGWQASAPDQAPEKKPRSKLMTEEARRSGQVDFEMYLTWGKAAGGLILVPVTIFISFALTEGVSIMSNWWLTYWSSHGGAGSQTKYLLIYGLINILAALTGLVRMLLIAVFGLRASRELFSNLLMVILHAPMSFFDTTPVGRLVNRFSKDIYTIDEQLSTTLRTYLMTLFNVVSTVVVISTITPVFVLCLLPMLLFYMKEQAFFTLTYRELKRIDSVNRSPIYALLGESIDGVAVIRAFSAEESLYKRLKGMLDVQQHAYYLTCAAQSWLAVRLELIGTLIISFASLSAVIQHQTGGANPAFAGLAGLSISYALSVTQSLNWSVRMASDMEANMVAVERLAEYSQVRSEGDRDTEVDKTLPSVWPSKGEIAFRSAKLRYRPELPLVLKGLDIFIPAGSKVGVVGRTGAGKSTLMVALMRIVELNEGEILIDGTDSRSVGLAKLRRNLAVIPQDPVLFSGSVKSNLDPFDTFNDKQLYDALESVGLYQGIVSSSHSTTSSKQRVESLADEVSEGGSNFSVGQRQLIVIARALLRGARVVIMDEATASVDAETDASIQKVMRSEFANATCITVAHRLHTIMDSDFILVMDDGRAAEFDAPKTLLHKGGLFRDLVVAAGIH